MQPKKFCQLGSKILFLYGDKIKSSHARKFMWLNALNIWVEIAINVDEDLITIFMEDQPKKLQFFLMNQLVGLLRWIAMWSKLDQ